MKGMSKGKAVGPSGLTNELLQAAGKVGIRQLRNIFKNLLLEGEEIPNDWKGSITIPIYIGKGDAVDCGNYRGVRFVSRTWYESVQICVGKETQKNCIYWKLSVWI